MIILKRKFVDVELHSGVGMKGEYRLQVVRQDGTVRQDTGWFDNIILDAGLNRWGSGDIIAGAAVGTGNSVPAATQTQLDVQTTFTTVQGPGHDARTVQAASPYYSTYTAVYRTALGALNGNYSEVGIGWLTNQLFSRALIVNNVGVPTSISIASTEQLDISYRLRMYPPVVDVTSSVVISGVTYNITGRSANVTNGLVNVGWYTGPQSPMTGNGSYLAGSIQPYCNGAIGAITAFPAGTAAILGAAPAMTAYSNNSLQRIMTITAGLTAANLAIGIRSVVAAWTGAMFQYEFSPVIPKDSTKTLALTFSINWARRP